MKTLNNLLLFTLLGMGCGVAAVVAIQTPPGRNSIREWSLPGIDPPILEFDLDGNGTADFRFSRFANLGASLVSTGGNRFISTPANLGAGGSVEGVAAGSILGADPIVVSGGWHATSVGGGGFDLVPLQFEDTRIGVEFLAEDGIHYGWIGYTGFGIAKVPLYDETGNYLGFVEKPDEKGGLIHSWAYETEPGKAIIAGAVPEPGTSLLLAIASLALLRRKR